MPILDFDKLTPDNQAVKDLKDLIQLTVFQNEDMERFMTFMPNVTNGKKAGFIGEMEDIGVAGSGCDPEYKKVAIAAAQKEWEIGDWQIPLEMCYTDLENTIAKYCLKTGTNIGDLTSTEYMDGIVLPKLSEAMMKMMWRFTWFGDKSAASVTGGGQITDGVNIELFKTCDGFSNVCLPSVPTMPNSTLKLQPTQKNHMHYKIKDERNRHCHINIRCDVARCRQPDFPKRRMRNFRHQVNVRCSDSRYERKVQGNHALGSCI